MNIEITSRFTGKVIYSHEQEGNTLKATLEKAVVEGVNLYGAHLKGANLYGANLRGSNLEGANLYGANLEGAYLYGANLKGANLYGANLKGANLRGSNLEGANLYGAYLYGANLYGAYLYGAYLEGANLEGATYGDATLNKGLLQLLGLAWPVYFFDGHINIGCEMHTISEWEGFSDEEINLMAIDALSFWKINKGAIINMAKSR